MQQKIIMVVEEHLLRLERLRLLRAALPLLHELERRLDETDVDGARVTSHALHALLRTF